METSMSPSPRPSFAIYALAAGVFVVLPLSFTTLLFIGIRDQKTFQFAAACATSLVSISGLIAAVSQWNHNRAMALGYLMMAVGAAFTTWGLYAPDLKLILAICSLVAAVLALALMYRPMISFLRQRRAGT
jgi:hypothetical protein